MKKRTILSALALATTLVLNAQTVKINGVAQMNRDNDGEQMHLQYVGWSSQLGKGLSISDYGTWTMTWDGTNLSSPVKSPNYSVSDFYSGGQFTDLDKAQWANNLLLMAGNSGTLFVNNQLVTIFSRDESSTTDEVLFAVRKWNATTGELLCEPNVYYPKSATLESAGMCYNPVDGKVYGLFLLTGQDLPTEITDDPDYFEDQDSDMTDGDAGYCLCVVDPGTLAITPITPGLYYYNFVTFAINSEGRAFALTSGGTAGAVETDGKMTDINGNLTGAQLCEFDLTTGLMKTKPQTAIDPETNQEYTENVNIYEHGTGYCSQYKRQSACFAKSNPNIMYWNGYVNSGKGINEYGSWSTLPDRDWRTNGKYDTALYAVDINTGAATKLANIDNRFTFSAMWVEEDDASIGSDINVMQGHYNPTGINDVNTTAEKATDNAWYNLQGQRVSQPSKGIFIHNGQKVVVK